MSGPWVRPNGNVVVRNISGSVSDFVETTPNVWTGHVALPADAIPLVPQTEVDAAKRIAEWLIAERVHGEWENFKSLPPDVKREVLGAGVQLPIPDATDPAHLRFAADVIELWNGRGFSHLLANDVRALAGRIEQEQAAKAAEHAKRDELIASLSKNGRLHPSDVLEIADYLLGKYELSPKAEG